MRRFSRRRIAESPGAIGGSAPAGTPLDPQNTEDAHVVLDGGDLRFGAVADDILESLDIALALGTLAKHDGGTFSPIDMGRSQERRREHVDADIPLLRALLKLQKFVNGRITACFVRKFRDSTDVLDAMACEELESLVGGRPALTPEFHQGALAARRGLGRKRGRRSGEGRASRGRAGNDEISAVHTKNSLLLGL